MRQVYAIIPARGGSKGVPKKNIRPLKGHPLIAYSIAAGLLAGYVERVIVSTDSTEIAAIAEEYGAEVPFMRPAELSGDRSTDRDFMVHAIDWFDREEGGAPEYWVHLRPTTPLREPTVVDKAIEDILARPEATSLRSAHPAPESPFKWFRRDEGGYFSPIADTMDNEMVNAPRQHFEDVFIPDGYVDILKTKYIRASGLVHGSRMAGFISPACREVDTIQDFDYLEYELETKGSALLDYLEKKHGGSRHGRV
jgi:CMP-N,N'-diacetyllegionaminic acid synthase